VTAAQQAEPALRSATRNNLRLLRSQTWSYTRGRPHKRDDRRTQNIRSCRWLGWRDAWQVAMRRPGWPRDGGSPLGCTAHLRWNGQGAASLLAMHPASRATGKIEYFAC